jgi:hypothetical protein
MENQVSLRVQNTGQDLLKVHLKSIIKELRNWQNMEMQIRNQSNIFKEKLDYSLMTPWETTLPLLLSLNVMYSLPCTAGLMLENNFELLLKWHEYLDSMIHMFSRPLTYSVKGHRMSKEHNTRASKLRRMIVLSHLFMISVRKNTKHPNSHWWKR